MSFNRYYQNELLILRELGREFAQHNPTLAPFLDTTGRDPDVERLFEGFAFLTGRLRQKLDDEFPEFTHGMFNMLWPNYLRPIPACSIVQYTPSSHVSRPVTIPKGSRVDSVQVQGTNCRFRTVYDTEVLPLKLDELRIIDWGGEAGIALKFDSTQSPVDNIPFSRLRFFLAGEPVIAHTLYFYLVSQLVEMRIVVRDDQNEPCVLARLNQESLRPMGFQEEESLYPYSDNTFPGYRILQEYFCFPEKFLFIEATDLEQGLNRDQLRPYKGATSFELHFIFKNLPEHFESFRTENFQLYCTPVVNLFQMDSSPLSLDHRQNEYRIVPDPRKPYHYAIYSVDSVGAWDLRDRKSQMYLPFESFAHDPEAVSQIHTYYKLRIQQATMDEGTETYISFIRPKGTKDDFHKETISLTLTCTNRLLPNELRTGDIRIHADSSPDAVSFTNITPVVPSFRPPLEGDLLWRLLSNMSLNYVSLTNIEALRSIIAAYDFRARYDRPKARLLEKTLQGMVSVSCKETDRLYNGLPVRGAQTTLNLDQRYFSCEGAMYLFASILNEFFALYATVNSFHMLMVEEVSSKEKYLWPARLGRITL